MQEIALIVARRRSPPRLQLCSGVPQCGGKTMTGYVSQPIEPFYVPPKVLKPHTRSHMSELPERANQGNAQTSSEHDSQFHKWNSPQVKIVMAVIFTLLYVLVKRQPALSAVCVIVLLICTLLRLDEYKRKIAQIPLTIAALMLASQIGPLGITTTWIGDPFQKFQIASLPLFFAVCLFYMPNGQSYTRKLLLAISVMLLASGLLPSAGFTALFVAVQYILFVAIVFGLGLDFANHQAAPKLTEDSQ
jgi:hypothetical protein